jgi:DNA polymerase (family 10)
MFVSGSFVEYIVVSCILRVINAGDLHVHSDYSDGAVSLSGIAEIALARGYRYIGITDHSQSLKVAKGLDQSALLKKRDAIARLNEQHKSLRILFGTEVEIMADGSLDYCDDILKEFDLVVAAVHSSFKQSRTQMTKRVVSACRNKYVNILAHPTAKLWGTRDSVDIDMDELLRVCRDTRVAMEMNCNGQRMDLNDAGAMQAKKMAVKLAINTDSHKPADFDGMAAGVYLARRAWLHPQDVINCLSYDELKKWLKK